MTWCLLVLSCVMVMAVSDRSPAMKVYWNVPSEQCSRRYNIHIPLQKFKIIANEGQKFIGDKITTFYEYKTGLWPHFFHHNASHPENGGIPQRGNLTEHLARFEQSILKAFPNPDYDGPAVVDMEEWRPLIELNTYRKLIYLEESTRLVQERDGVSEEEAREIGKREFNEAAKSFIVGTLRLGRSLRPKAKWGLYGFPICNYESEEQCHQTYSEANDKLKWMYDEQTALFPSIYIYKSGIDNPAKNARHVRALLREATRIQTAMKPTRRLPIYAFTKIEYEPYDSKYPFYSKVDLCNSLRQAADFEVDATIIWGASKYLDNNLDNRCNAFAKNIEHLTGPYLNAIRSARNDCSKRKCNGHGTCVRTVFTDSCDLGLKESEFRCRCQKGWRGRNCQHRK